LKVRQARNKKSETGKAEIGELVKGKIRRLRYWLPPVLWMIFLFPLWNRFLASPFLYRLNIKFWKWLAEDISWYKISLYYIYLRRFLHVAAYALMAFLIYRFFRGDEKQLWKNSWAGYTALIAIGYGCVDETLQYFLKSRSSSMMDILMDAIGIALVLAVIYGMSLYRMGNSGWLMDKRCLFLKRPFDILVSGFGVILSSPLWIVFGLLIWLEDKGSIFYTQEREGKGGRLFKACKFRSMIKDAEIDGTPVQAGKNDPRVTPIGRLLRATAMDELPQLVNIFRGDMSFVGPRALRPEEVESREIVNGEWGIVNGRRKMENGKWKRPNEPRKRENGEKRKAVSMKDIPGYKERQKVRPGLTGLAQVFLPADAPRTEKFLYDVFYIKKQSFWFDLQLIFRSFWISFRGKWEADEK